MRFSGPVWD
uniref:B cell maturation antigen transcript variant 3 n=1 Tax=Homo sapiens TaxID=9606 RepID=A7KBT4_HUMAN|nr:B cell maturation antigen transcript variant 3 [Homo sapiens]